MGAQQFYRSLSPTQRRALPHHWRAWARPNQWTPSGDWLTWLVMAGRGFGKTRIGAEWIRQQVDSKASRRIALLGRTPADARDVMLEGDSGLLEVFPPHQRPKFEPTRRRVTFHTGAIATLFSSENPDQLRGPQHDTAWVDELGTFNTSESWDNLQLGLRLGRPRQIVTTTPRPISALRELVELPDTVITSGTTYDNRANLAAAFFRQVVTRYAGTRLGRQEIEGILLDDVPGALWRRRFIKYKPADELVRVVIGVDPSVGGGDESNDECGIVAAGQQKEGDWRVLEDVSLRATPLVWANAVIGLYHKWKADYVVAEVNNGGEMVELTLRTVDPSVRYKYVHAAENKRARAQPVSALYEQGRVYHREPMRDLEDQLCTWDPDETKSPDRLDAMVWALTELALVERYTFRVM